MKRKKTGFEKNKQKVKPLPGFLSWMEPRKILSYFLAFYIGLLANVHTDYLLNHRKKLRENGGIENYMCVKKYEIKIDKKEKNLVLVGESHIANKMEHELSKKILKEYKDFDLACEYDRRPLSAKLSLGNRILTGAVYVPSAIINYFERLGDGRSYDSIGELVNRSGDVDMIDVDDALDRYLDSFGVLKFLAAVGTWGSLLAAPVSYYKSKSEKPIDFFLKRIEEEEEDSGYDHKFLIEKRDAVMAKNLASLLRKKDNLLAVVGRAHVKGIVKNLSNEFKLEEVK